MSLEELAIIKKFKCYFKASIIVNEKVASLKIDPELWKKVKMLAVKRGVTLKSLIEELLVLEVEGEEFSLGEANVSTQLLETLEERSRRGLLPFTIKSKRSAVELVKEGRGE